MPWTFEHTEHTDARPESIWALWSDVSSWPQWDEGLERVTLDGPFATGSRGTLKPAGGPGVRFELTDVRPCQGFADVLLLPLCRMRFEHAALRDDAGTRVTHRVTIAGPTTPIFARLIGRGIARSMPDTVHALIRMARQREAVLAA